LDRSTQLPPTGGDVKNKKLEDRVSRAPLCCFYDDAYEKIRTSSRMSSCVRKWHTVVSKYITGPGNAGKLHSMANIPNSSCTGAQGNVGEEAQDNPHGIVLLLPD